jgi:hypothetical protein
LQHQFLHFICVVSSCGTTQCKRPRILGLFTADTVATTPVRGNGTVQAHKMAQHLVVPVLLEPRVVGWRTGGARVAVRRRSIPDLAVVVWAKREPCLPAAQVRAPAATARVASARDNHHQQQQQPQIHLADTSSRNFWDVGSNCQESKFTEFEARTRLFRFVCLRKRSVWESWGASH